MNGPDQAHESRGAVVPSSFEARAKKGRALLRMTVCASD
jgi:hypothetical protein